MECCPFCHYLEKRAIGEYVRIGVVCNCDTNDHIYRDGYITRRSICDNIIRLFDAPVHGDVIFTACCEDIFEIYLFDIVPAVAPPVDNIDIATMVEQRRSLLRTVQGDLQKEDKANE